MPKGHNSKGSEQQFQYKKKGNFDSNAEADSKNKKDKGDLYRCGDPACGKQYHSYTAFYNHCKKSHGGQFPQNSLHNDKIFEGPSKNRGRPRIKKNETKDSVQIQQMKRENELIEFLGTLKTKKAQQLIVHVEDPTKRLQSAIQLVKEWLKQAQQLSLQKIQWTKDLITLNKIITQNDLPEFYDPIQSDLYRHKLDSYNFISIYVFMNNSQKRQMLKIKYQGYDLLYRILCVWLARILSQNLLAQVLYTVVQIQYGNEIKQKQLLVDRSDKFKQVCDRYFQYFGSKIQNEQNQRDNE